MGSCDGDVNGVDVGARLPSGGDRSTPSAIFQWEGIWYEVPQGEFAYKIVLPDKTLLRVGDVLETYPAQLEGLTEIYTLDIWDTPEELAEAFGAVLAQPLQGDFTV